MLKKNSLINKTKNHLLDTSAIITLLKKEPGYEILDEIIASSAMSVVNLTELVSMLTRSGVIDHEVDEVIKDIVPEILQFTEDIAIEAGKLIKHTKSYGLSLGDRACIATGIQHNMKIFTADKIWKELKLPVEIIIIR
jgi:PIN domain nuclease of toxin-antitoxin system